MCSAWGTESTPFCTLLLVACISPGHAEVAAQGIHGVVLDRVTNRPIELAVVTLVTVDGDSVAWTALGKTLSVPSP
jgi:hypothetical protein